MKILQEYREQWKELSKAEKVAGWLLIPAMLQTIFLWIAWFYIKFYL